MQNLGFFAWGIVGLITVGLLLVLFSPNARLRRRLRKTHSRIASKSHRPTVRFSVKSPRKK
jgi:hypothetical protein